MCDADLTHHAGTCQFLVGFDISHHQQISALCQGIDALLAGMHRVRLHVHLVHLVHLPHLRLWRHAPALETKR